MVTVQMDRMVGHGEISHPDADAVALARDEVVDAGEGPAVPCPEIEFGHGHDLGHVAAGIDVIGVEEEDEVAVDPHELRIARVNDEKAHHAHRHLHHLVCVRVVHERSALLQNEFIDEGLAGLDVRLRQATDTVHAVGKQHAVPMHGGVLGQLVRHKDADFVALDGLDGRAGRLAVVTPQMRLHAGRDFAHHGLGDEMEFLPIAIHAPRQGPAVERYHRLIVRPARWRQRRLHRRRRVRRRLGDHGGLNAPGHDAGAGEGRGRSKDASSCCSPRRSPSRMIYAVLCVTLALRSA